MVLNGEKCETEVLKSFRNTQQWVSNSKSIWSDFTKAPTKICAVSEWGFATEEASSCVIRADQGLIIYQMDLFRC